MNIITEKKETKKYVTHKRYFADDGTEFKTEEECEKYETDNKLKYLAEKYQLKDSFCPDFITSRFVQCSYTIHIPKDLNMNEVIELLKILIDYSIDEDDKHNFLINYDRDLGNVRTEDKSVTKLNDYKIESDKVYFFYLYHYENCDSYDDFVWTLVSEEEARKLLQREVDEFEKIYDIKYKE